MIGASGASGKSEGVLGYFVRHRTAANLLVMIMMVAGLFAATKIRAQFFPDVAVDTINVSVTWNGAGPREMDEAIVARIEPRLRTIEGVKTATATAKQGAATVTLEFQPGHDIAAAIDDAQAPLDERHKVEVSELAERIQATGERGSGRKDLEARQRREARRLRTDELRFGFAVVSERYRAQLTEAGDPAPALASLKALRDASEELVRNPNEALMLQALMLRLSPAV